MADPREISRMVRRDRDRRMKARRSGRHLSARYSTMHNGVLVLACQEIKRLGVSAGL